MFEKKAPEPAIPELSSTKPTSTTSSTTPRRICENSWFSKLKIVWHLYTLAPFGAVLHLLPGSDASFGLSNGHEVIILIKAFACWTVFDFGVIWAYSLIFANKDIQRAWKTSHNCEQWFIKYLPEAWWTSVIVLMLLGSISFYL